MPIRKKRPTTRRSTRRPARRKATRPWSPSECAFMRKYYRNHETKWVARQMGRTVYSVRYKAVDLNIKKSKPSVWKGNKGPKTAFKRFGGSTKAGRKSTARRRPTRRSGFRSTSRRRTTRKSSARRKTRKSSARRKRR
ncbi:MAG: hypothetical protein IH931_09025 [candidate division Zixibacteria bacterium]|nr:hypothetical protein [candidate division Zixibacteria bacterium]